MRVKSVRKLEQILRSEWARENEVQLTRTGPRSFVLGNTQSGDFRYGMGWGQAASFEAEGHASALQRRRILPWLLGGAVGLALVVILGVSTWNRVAPIISDFAKAPTVAAAKAHRQPSTIDVSPKTTCTLSSPPNSPLKLITNQRGAQTLVLQHDIVIGGEREQSVSLACRQGTEVISGGQYLVRYWLDRGAWKAKSATPVGSRSRYGTN